MSLLTVLKLRIFFNNKNINSKILSQILHTSTKMKKLTQEQKSIQEQNELLRLEKDFRAMLNDDEATKQRDKLIIANQNVLIKLLEKEKGELKTTNPEKTSKTKETKESTEIEGMLEEYTNLKDKINTDNFNLDAINAEIKKVMDEILKIKKTDKLGDESVKAIARQDKIDDNLEEKLDVETQKFNRVLMDNEELRNEIDVMLNERERFNRTFFALTAQLQAGKKIIFDMIEQSTMAYDNRVDYEARITALRTKAKADLLHHCLEFEDLIRQFYRGLDQRSFIAVKSLNRIMDSSEKDRIRNDMHLALGQKIEEYQLMIGEMKEIFEENDLEKIVMQFQKIEEDNYNIFSFVNEQNKRLNAARQDICEIQKNITSQRLENERNSSSNSAVLRKMEEEFEKGRYEVLLAKRELRKSEKTYKELLAGIQTIFVQLSCELYPIDRLLGDNSIVKPSNVKYYLKNLEDRLMAIGTVHKYQLDRQTPRKTRGFSLTDLKDIGNAPSDLSQMSVATTMIEKYIRIDTRDPAARIVVAGTPCPLCAEIQDISDIDESFAMPADFSELRNKLIKEMKQEQAEIATVVHPLETCPLPASRRILQTKLKM